jgi:hypothetical protein
MKQRVLTVTGSRSAQVFDKRLKLYGYIRHLFALFFYFVIR